MNSALISLRDILSYISLDNPNYALFIQNRIFEMVDHLRQFPKIGRVVPEYKTSNIREILFKGYRIIYQLKGEYIEILAVFHGSRKLDEYRR
ncbi:MAG: type II toxin-antitoxin system RelE/ParE family toxin [Promethearchaeota archaeon]